MGFIGAQAGMLFQPRDRRHDETAQTQGQTVTAHQRNAQHQQHEAQFLPLLFFQFVEAEGALQNSQLPVVLHDRHFEIKMARAPDPFPIFQSGRQICIQCVRVVFGDDVAALVQPQIDDARIFEQWAQLFFDAGFVVENQRKHRKLGYQLGQCQIGVNEIVALLDIFFPV
ncbi:hypothetical protein [Methylomonas koyamae]|uniref:hypothetical protein n=1 Tax=Methylomonas koyamae TaxID=702114 RepID=UPI0006D0596F|nr:hypothetical protein [Methylomonas koyamae]